MLQTNVYGSVYTPDPLITFEGPWSEFIGWMEYLSQQERARKEDNVMLCPSVIQPGGRRLLNHRHTDFMLLDYDQQDPAFLEQVKRTFQAQTYLIYGTARHTPEAPRFRLVVPLARRILCVEEYRSLCRGTDALFPPNQWDTAPMHAAAVLYAPSRIPVPLFEVNEGLPLDVDKILEKAATLHRVERAPAYLAMTVSDSRLAALLDRWIPDHHKTIRNVAFALLSGTDEHTARSLWLPWASSSHRARAELEKLWSYLAASYNRASKRPITADYLLRGNRPMPKIDLTRHIRIQ